MPDKLFDKFRHRIAVQQSDIDELGHVNNVIYLQWVQEVAAAHWNSLAPADMKEQYSWVVLRHEIDYHRPAFMGDEIEGFTWVGAHQGPKMIRYVSLCKAGSQELLAEATTTWCLLDAASMRPRRISDEINQTFSSYTAG
ncbi:thioesterase [Flammeovirgaceae bacterium 311]|nr:thioesterase [Flammeovirgaceae bacterium 311]